MNTYQPPAPAHWNAKRLGAFLKQTRIAGLNEISGDAETFHFLTAHKHETSK